MSNVGFVLSAFLLLGVASIHAWGSEETNEIEQSKSTVSVAEIKSTEERGRLIADLFHNYDKRNYPSNITHRFGVSLLKFDVDEYKNTIDVDIWTKQSWADHRLRWNPAEYGGQTVIRLPSHLVWKPDTTLYNSASRHGPPECTDTNILVDSDGKVIWVPPCNFKAYCNLSLDTAPYGKQHCSLKFGSWTFDGLTMDLQFYGDKSEADLSDFYDTSEWEISENTAVREESYYECCEEPYISLNFEFAFQRRTSTSGGSCSDK